MAVVLTPYIRRFVRVVEHRILALYFDTAIFCAATTYRLCDRFFPGADQDVIPCKCAVNTACCRSSALPAAFGKKHNKLVVIIKFIFDNLQFITEEGNIVKKRHFSFKADLGGVQTLKQCPLVRVAPHAGGHHQPNGFTNAGATPEVNYKRVDPQQLNQYRSAGGRQKEAAFFIVYAAVVSVCHPHVTLTFFIYRIKYRAIIIFAVVDVPSAVGNEFIAHPTKAADCRRDGDMIKA